MKRPTVIIRDCPDYTVERIRRLARDGLELLNLRPHGRTLVKPNVVASGANFPHAFTRSEFTEGVLRALKDRDEGQMTELAVGERCGITMPTRFAYRNADYYAMTQRVGDVGLYHFDEVPQVEIPLYHEGRLRDSIYVSEPVAQADFFVNCPKFKAHPWTTVTFSMKNYIGLQDDRHRLLDHDHRLNEKVADLQYVIQPQFIAIDGVIAGEGRMLTPNPFDLGLMVMGDNQLAFDAVCCHIIGLDPLSVDHLRLAYERGFGPVELDQIEIVGDLERAQAKAHGFEKGLIRVEEYFKGTNIRAYGGRPPSDDVDYCWGGCPGALEEAIEILRIFDKKTDERMPRIHIIFGAYDGEIDAGPGEKVVFMGDCASFNGEVDGDLVQIESIYVDRSQRDPLEAKSGDIFHKMVTVGARLRSLKHGNVTRIAGCPVSVAEQVLLLVKLGKLKNPYFDPSQSIPFTSCYLSWRTRQLLGRLFGGDFNKNIPGPAERGDARPIQNAPPSGVPTPLEA